MRWSPPESIVAAAQPAGAPHDEAVGGRLGVAAQRVERAHHRGDPVGLLDAQLLGAGRRPSRPRRSSPAGRRAAARRWPAAPRRARSPWRAAGRRGARAGRRPARRVGTPTGSGSSRSPSTVTPMRSRMRMNPTRVQLVAVLRTRTSAPGTIAAAASQKAALDGSPGTSHVLELELVAGVDGHVAPVAHDVDAGPRRASARCGRGSAPARTRSSRRRPTARPAARTTSPGRWPSAARSGSACSREPCTTKGGKRPSVASMRAPIRPAARRCGRPGAGGSSGRRPASRRGPPARPATRAAGASACRRCRRRSGARWSAPRAARCRG